MYDDDRLGAAARCLLDLCSGRLHFREYIETSPAGGVVVGFEEERMTERN